MLVRPAGKDDVVIWDDTCPGSCPFHADSTTVGVASVEAPPGAEAAAVAEGQIAGFSGRRSAAKLLTKDKARRIAVNISKPPSYWAETLNSSPSSVTKTRKAAGHG